MRTQQEIVDRLAAVKERDMFGFASYVLIGSLDFEHAKPFLKDGTTTDDWKPSVTDEAVKKKAVEYLDFAFGKAEDHRGISAARSVQKMEQYLWLLGLDVDSFNSINYAPYGAPQLKRAAELLGVPLPTTQPIARMLEGEGCSSECDQCFG